MSEPSLKNKLAWQCRRGMLELDVILIPFLEQHFDSLSENEQKIFSLLLEEADPDLYTWLMGYGDCEKEEIASLIKHIKKVMQVGRD
ncbi:succinate dehydrogenase assembly factor 2 [Aliikangiella sp. G2MR2-5]|uniref:FAD assembly factor SdhE n=1 Tax=Aliikangiella sp. G2MR2-5 TaxID=2788943 RepID=UPI0018A8D7FA|nr:succinate dehydrogenase assembly factor 2 [Aliikangiella sp. G2MR2-5]